MLSLQNCIVFQCGSAIAYLCFKYSVMQPKRQHGWLYLVGPTPEATPNDGDKEGWYKVEKVAKFKGHKVMDNRTCIKQGCP